MTPRIITADEARVLREAATPGPWRVEGSSPSDFRLSIPRIGDVTRQDGLLAAAAPDLAATVEALHAEVARLHAGAHPEVARLLAERDRLRSLLISLLVSLQDARKVTP
jgi:hypothetical protein